MQPGRLQAGVAPACGRQGAASVDSHPGVESGVVGQPSSHTGHPSSDGIAVANCSHHVAASTTFGGGGCLSRRCFSNVCSPCRSYMQCLILVICSNGARANVVASQRPGPKSHDARTQQTTTLRLKPEFGIFAGLMSGTTDQCHPPFRLLYPAHSHWVSVLVWREA